MGKTTTTVGVAEMEQQDDAELRVEISARAELDELHAMLDMLWAGDRDMPAADRLRDFLREGAGDLVARRVNPELGKALAAAWFTRDRQCRRTRDCPCHACREAVVLEKTRGEIPFDERNYEAWRNAQRGPK